MYEVSNGSVRLRVVLHADLLDLIQRQPIHTTEYENEGDGRLDLCPRMRVLRDVRR